MRNRKRWKARSGALFKGLVVVTLTLVSVRSGVYVYKSFADEPSEQKIVQEKKEIPSAARGTAGLFLWNWYYTAPKETVESKKGRVEPFISSNVTEKLRAKNVIPMSQMEPLRVESWDSETVKWLEEGKRAVLTFKVLLKDGRDLYVSVPIVKAGTWQVDGLPALLPEPSKKSAPNLEADIDQNVLEDIHSSLDAFFPMWLSGKEEAIKRYVIGNKLPLNNVLGEVQGVYEEVSIQPIKENPVTVNALVKVRTAEEEMFFEYTIVLEKVDNQWKIKELY